MFRHIHRSATPGAGAVLGEYLDSSICTEFIAAFGALRQASLLDSVRCCFRWGAVGFLYLGVRSQVGYLRCSRPSKVTIHISGR